MGGVGMMNLFGSKRKTDDDEMGEYIAINAENIEDELPYLSAYLKQIKYQYDVIDITDVEALAKRYYNANSKFKELNQKVAKIAQDNDDLTAQVSHYKAQYTAAMQAQIESADNAENSEIIAKLEAKIKTLQSELSAYKNYIKETDQKKQLRAFRSGQGGRKKLVVDWQKYDTLRANGANQQQAADIMKIGVSTLRKKLKERKLAENQTALDAIKTL